MTEWPDVKLWLQRSMPSDEQISTIETLSLMRFLMFVCLQKDAKQCCDVTTPESIHTKDESKRGFAFAFIFGVNWPSQWVRSRVVPPQHCLASFWRQTNIKIFTRLRPPSSLPTFMTQWDASPATRTQKCRRCHECTACHECHEVVPENKAIRPNLGPSSIQLDSWCYSWFLVVLPDLWLCCLIFGCLLWFKIWWCCSIFDFKLVVVI